MANHGMGRIPSPRDKRDFKMSAYLKLIEEEKVKPVQYVDYARLNQKDTGHCVGFGYAGLEASTPIVVPKVTDNLGHQIYYRCKIKDGEPDSEDGTTVRTGAKVLKDDGRIGAYFFADRIEEAAQYVSDHGPVVLGIKWLEGMFTPDAKGIIHPVGDTKGGHCVLWYGISDDGYAIIRNSWGEEWGLNGDCLLLMTDLSILFADDGEACAATEPSDIPDIPDVPVPIEKKSGFCTWFRNLIGKANGK